MPSTGVGVGWEALVVVWLAVARLAALSITGKGRDVWPGAWAVTVSPVGAGRHPGLKDGGMPPENPEQML